MLRSGGTAFIIDNDLRHGQFADWLKRHPFAGVDPDVVEGFWSAQGYQLVRILSEWRFDNRADLEAVVRLEFGEALGNDLLRSHGIERRVPPRAVLAALLGTFLKEVGARHSLAR
ncbi:hypothetical protein [Candidatus Flexifilum breve]|uniref:hypothetical protein n=1 Tax=Candidatus Flexifilum breve TaxID=3140694 RepID=UPI0031CCD81A